MCACGVGEHGLARSGGVADLGRARPRDVRAGRDGGRAGGCAARRGRRRQRRASGDRRCPNRDRGRSPGGGRGARAPARCRRRRGRRGRPPRLRSQRPALSERSVQRSRRVGSTHCEGRSRVGSHARIARRDRGDRRHRRRRESSRSPRRTARPGANIAKRRHLRMRDLAGGRQLARHPCGRDHRGDRQQRRRHRGRGVRCEAALDQGPRLHRGRVALGCGLGDHVRGRPRCARGERLDRNSGQQLHASERGRVRAEQGRSRRRGGR